MTDYNPTDDELLMAERNESLDPTTRRLARLVLRERENRRAVELSRDYHAEQHAETLGDFLAKKLRAGKAEAALARVEELPFMRSKRNPYAHRVRAAIAGRT